MNTTIVGACTIEGGVPTITIGDARARCQSTKTESRQHGTPSTGVAGFMDSLPCVVPPMTLSLSYKICRMNIFPLRESVTVTDDKKYSSLVILRASIACIQSYVAGLFL
jgi:hypothetical protein